MITKISNKYLTVEVKSHGAELTSIRSNKSNLEYLWQADAAYWSRHAPVLFPIVGKLKNNQYTYKDQVYTLPQHGFARDTEFEVSAVSKDQIRCVLQSSTETRANYPFDFQLQIDYTLHENTLAVKYTVINPANDTMYFSIGAHPGFNCPLEAGETMEDYDLEFQCEESLDSIFLENNLLSHYTEPFLQNEQKVKLSPDLFKRDAIIVKNIKSKGLTMKSRLSGKALSVSCEGFPYIGIWSKPSGAPFLCIEPWYGIADAVDSKGDFVTKEGILSLAGLEHFDCQFIIGIEE